MAFSLPLVYRTEFPGVCKHEAAAHCSEEIVPILGWCSEPQMHALEGSKTEFAPFAHVYACEQGG